ncbi:MAG: TIR domain-containing protein [Oscillospiraceae bacterium]|nr:TIR domain-containing protein [Oscillospiraceae bacterium]
MEKEYIYDAFISYRHTSHDKAVAEKLQKMLESYKPPKSVKGDFKRWRIFRDETELPTSSNLSEDIKHALENSRYLIVVCSESTKDSRWCMEEITYFKELHNGNNANIITILSDGEPQTAFPLALCTEMIDVTDSEGNVSRRSHVIEPLAANIVAPTLQGSLRKLKTEFLRIAAPLLGVGYDALYNRNQKRTVRRIITIAALIFAFLFAFGLYTSAMLYEINTQKAALEAANANLEAKTQELDESNRTLMQTNEDLAQKTAEAEANLQEAERQRAAAETNLREAEKQKAAAMANLREAERQRAAAEANLREAERQRAAAEANLQEANRQRTIAQTNEAIANEQTKIAQVENSESLVTLSKTLWNHGDGVTAIDTVLSALPSESNPRPLVLSAKRTLANQIGAFEQKNFKNTLKIIYDSAITDIGYAGDGKTIVAKDNKNNIYFHNAETGALIKKYTPDNFDNHTPYIYYDNTGEIKTAAFEKKNGDVYVMDASGATHGFEKVSVDENISGSDILITAGKSFFKLCGKTGEILWESVPSGYSLSNVYVTEAEIARIDNNSDNTGHIIEIFDRFSGELTERFEIESYKLNTYSTKYVGRSRSKLYFSTESPSESYKPALMCFDVYGEKAVNPTVIYDAGADSTYDSFTYSDIYAFDIADNTAYAVFEHSNSASAKRKLGIFTINAQTADVIWRTETDSPYSTGIVKTGVFRAERCNNFCDMYFCLTPNKVMYFNASTGDLLYSYDFGGSAACAHAASDGILFIITKEGSEIAVASRNRTKEEPEPHPYLTRTLLNKPEKCAYYSAHYATVNANSNEALIFEDVKNDDFLEIHHATSDDIRLNSSKTYAVIDEYTKISVYDIKANKLITIAAFDNYGMRWALLNDTKLLVQNDKSIAIYNITTGGKTAQLTLPDGVYSPSSDPEVFCGKAVFRGNGTILFVDEYGKISEHAAKRGEMKPSTGYDFFTSDDGSKLITKTKYSGYNEHGKYENVSYFEVYTSPALPPVVLELEEKDESGKGLEIEQAIFLSANSVLLRLSDGTTGHFDLNSGKCLQRRTYALPSVVSLVYIGSDTHIGVLCNDSKLYKVEIESGEVSSSVDLENDRIRMATSDSTEAQYIPELNMLALSGWQIAFGLEHTYLIDLSAFEVCYDISGMECYLPGDNSVITARYDIIGKYPLYSTAELSAKAKQ